MLPHFPCSSASLTRCAMVDRPSASLPYGLSDLHRQNRTMGKATELPVGECARWKIPSLEQLSANPIILPISEVRRNFEPTHKRSIDSSESQLENLRGDSMTSTSAELRKSKRASASTESRRRPSNAVPHCRPQTTKRNKASVPASKKDSRESTWKRSIDPGTRTGASKDVPITIDDDEASDIGEEAYGRPGFSRSNFEATSPTPSFNGIYSPRFSTPNPTRDATHSKTGYRSMRGTYLTPPERVADNARRREPSIYIG
jgi:hypothetical protein